MIANDLAAGPQTARTEEETAPGYTRETAAPGDESAVMLLPQTLGSVFDGAFDLYKRHFGTLALIVALVFIPTQVILHAAGNVWLRPLVLHTNGENPDPFEVLQVLWLSFIIGVPGNGIPGYLSLLTSFMASGPVALAVANILFGRPVTIGTAYQRALPVFWRLFWTWNLLFLMFCAVFFGVFVLLFFAFVMLAAALGSAGANAGILGGPEIGIAFIILWVVLPYLISCTLGALLFSFAPPLIALENATVLSAPARNNQLVSRKLFWRTWFAITFLPIVAFGLQIIILTSAAMVADALKLPAWAGFVLKTGLSSLISFFFQPYWMIFVTLLYFDCRIRREGLDVRYMADNLPVNETPARLPSAMPLPSSAPPVPPPVSSAPSPPLTMQPGVPPLPARPVPSETEGR